MNEQIKMIPFEAIGKILNEVMELSVKNGANSVSIPDEYVAVAHFLSFPEKYVAPMPADTAGGVTDDQIFEIVARALGNSLLAEDLRGGFAILTEAEDWIKVARSLLSLASKQMGAEGCQLSRNRARARLKPR